MEWKYMKIVNNSRLLGITAGLAFCQSHNVEEIRKELKFLESLTTSNDNIIGKLYAITWALENNSQVIADKLSECKTELMTRKLGHDTHTRMLSQ